MQTQVIDHHATIHGPIIKPSLKGGEPDYGAAALAFYRSGWIPIPLIPDTLIPAVNQDKWLEMLCGGRIRGYWNLLPWQELGIIMKH